MRSALVVMAVSGALAGCAATPVGEKDLLTFLHEQHISRERVAERLGKPSAAFESCHVLSYRIAENESGYYVVARAHNEWRGIQEGVPYDVVIAFDDQGAVREYNVAAVKYPPRANDEPEPRVPSSIRVGSTRREEVLLQLGAPDGAGRASSWFWYGSGYRGGYHSSIAHDRDSLLATLRALEAPRLLISFDSAGVVRSAEILPGACWETNSEACERIASDDPHAAANAAAPTPRSEDVITQLDNVAIASAGSWITGDWEGGEACFTSTGAGRPQRGIQQGRVTVTPDALVLGVADGVRNDSTAVLPALTTPVRIPWTDVADVSVDHRQSGGALGIPIIDVIAAIAHDIETEKIASWLQIRLKDHSCIFIGGPNAAPDFSEKTKAILKPLVDQEAQKCVVR